MAKNIILNIHKIGDYEIIEQEGSFFKSGVEFVVKTSPNTGHVYPSLDSALVGAIALKYDGINTQAPRLICNMLGIVNMDEIE